MLQNNLSTTIFCLQTQTSGSNLSREEEAKLQALIRQRTLQQTILYTSQSLDSRCSNS